MSSQEMILLRTTWLDDAIFALMTEWQSRSGVPVAALVDNRRNPPLAPLSNLVPLNDSTFAATGLFCPSDVGWRCGDYGLYVARSQFPDVEHFWLVEDNIRIDGDVPRFFHFFDERKCVDFLAARLRPADWDYYWWPNAQGRGIIPHRCQFGLIRISAKSLDFLYTKRLDQSSRWNRRLIWPNDEAFVATTLCNSEFSCADLNSFGESFYSDESYRLIGDQTLRGECSNPTIVHPVPINRHVPATATTSATNRYTRRDGWLVAKRTSIVRRLNRRLPW